MRNFAFIPALLLFCAVARADAPSFDEAVHQTLAHSPEVATAQAHVSYAESKLRLARWGFFRPELRLFAGENAVTGTTKGGVQVSQDMIRFLTLNGDEVRQAARDLLVAQQNLIAARRRVTHQVVEALTRLRRAEDQVQLNADELDDQCTLLALSHSGCASRAGRAKHLLSVPEPLVKAQHAFRQAEQEQWQARVELSQLLGDP